VEIVRYRAGEAIRWLQTGAENIRRSAKAKGRSMIDPEHERTFGQNIKTAAGAVFDYGKGAYADMMHKQAEASEYVLLEKHFDIVNGSVIKAVPYDRVRKVELKNDKATVMLDKGTIYIKPFAHIVSGKAKVPVGWSRNGIEVPFELLVEELAARCGLDVDEPT
jgi:hypothetical protein